MAALCRICDWPFALLLNDFVLESLPVPMLAVPNGLGLAILESNHIVFPIANVIAELAKPECITLVVGVEVHIKGVHKARAVIIYYDSTTYGAMGLSSC
jgi:hypothetical protein